MVKNKDQVFGLSSQEAEARLQTYGLNQIEQKTKLSLIKVFLNQFTSPLIYILFFAGLITLFLNHWTDAVVIFLAVGVNAILGFIQEFKAEKALEALKKILIPQTKVIRDGKEMMVESSNLVAGDLVILNTGNKIPADGKLIKTIDFHVNEAILTGESEPLAKKTKDQVFMGTVVVSGRAEMIIESTGKKTKMGQIASKLSQTTEEETPLKKQVAGFSKTLALIFMIICLIIFFEGLWRGKPLIEIFTLSVAVAVAAIPEGLVISLTVILTLGMQRILKRKGLVRKLLAAETLGSVDVICSDKTGTLTEGKMQVVESKFTDDSLGLRAIGICNNMTNPLEIAMMDWAKKQPINLEQEIKTNPRVDEIPFSSDKKLIAILTTNKAKKQGEIFVSGAPEMMMAMAKMSPAEKKQWRKKLDDYTKKGLRVVAFSHETGDLTKLQANFSRLKKNQQKYDQAMEENWDWLDLKWLGLLLFEDPSRKEVKQSLKLCRQAGIKVKVITGDYCNTAVAILKKIGLFDQEPSPDQIIEGWQLEKISKEELAKKIDQVVLFCRTTPEQKIRIVEALQAKGHSVVMMGDGVNDALALKKADIGIVVGEASEVAKETADMVLLDSNFNTIVAAVEEGRGIFENIKKVILYLLSSSFTETILIGGTLLLGLPLPVLAVQILWVNLVQDGLPSLALAFEPVEKSLMKNKPRDRQEGILDSELKVLIFIVGIVTDILLFIVFTMLIKTNLDLKLTQSVIFAALGTNSLFYVFSCKSLRQNLWQTNIFDNQFLLLSVITGFAFMFSALYLPGLQLFFNTTPLNLWLLLLVLFLGLFNVSLIELTKWLFLKKRQVKINNS